MGFSVISNDNLVLLFEMTVPCLLIVTGIYVGVVV